MRNCLTDEGNNNAIIRHIPTWLNRPLGPGWWLNEKNNRFGWAYIRASRNLYELRNVMRYRDRTTTGDPVIPNVPVVYMSFMGCMHNCVPDANDGEFFTGMCLVGAKCTDTDFVPRNDSIIADAWRPQMTANQEAAIKTLNAVGTRKFWEDAVHANGISGASADIVMAQWRITQEALDGDARLKEKPTESEDFIWDVAWGVIAFFAFTALLCACFTRRTHKFNHPCEN